MTTCEHVLHGCAPVPLGSYLKALGVFRLVAEQADPDARGFWRDGRFVLKTRLKDDELVQFFAEDYQPTPVVTPWNGGSGFWLKDNTEGIAAIEASNVARLQCYRAAIRSCRTIIATSGYAEPPKEDGKGVLLFDLRATLSDEACRWLDGAVALSADGPRYPPILGTGGNDGRLDFSNNFMRHLVRVIASDSANCDLLRAALLGMPAPSLDKGAVGQFSPGTAGGANATTGFDAQSWVNPWDFVLTIEGALMFAAAVARRHAWDRVSGLSFPFTTRVVGVGCGGTAPTDEADARAEFWAPLWTRAVALNELRALMSEGRAVLESGEGVRDGLEFARAAARLGTARGIASFQRHGFLMRAGKAYLATPLSLVQVRENPRASLISALDKGAWLKQARKAVRDKSVPARLSDLGRHLDEALFKLAGDGSAAAVQEALIAVGALAIETGRRPKLRTMAGGLPPPPHLPQAWAEAADDGSADFLLAEALAGLDASVDDGVDKTFRLPFRQHLAALAINRFADEWDDTTEAQVLAVWTGRDLVRDMAAVLERRLIEAQHRSFVRSDGSASELPLRGRRGAPLAAVAAFLAQRTDDGRIAALASGLAWVQPRGGAPSSPLRNDITPFAYAALKPLFAPSGVGKYDAEKKHVDPLPLVRLLRAGRAAEAVVRAQRLARGAGLPVPFGELHPSPPADPMYLAAALLFPIAPKACDRLLNRAYPDLHPDEQDSYAA